MDHFLHQLIDPTAVLMLYVFLFSISTQAYPAYSNRAETRIGVWPILWIILAIVSLIAWCFIVF